MDNGLGIIFSQDGKERLRLMNEHEGYPLSLHPACGRFSILFLLYLSFLVYYLHIYFVWLSVAVCGRLEGCLRMDTGSGHSLGGWSVSNNVKR